jgi:dipeptidyl aminopeptidase/acylaminoacyl peptidase
MISARGATPEEDPDYYRRTSPLQHAAGVACPVLLVHGTLDLVIPHDHSLWMAAALRDAGHGDVELELLEHVGHFFERTYSGYVFDDVAALVTAWLTRRLLEG